MARPIEWALTTLYIVSVCVLAVLSVTLIQEKVIPWPLENLGLTGAFFSILSLLLVLSFRVRLPKRYRAFSLILLAVALLGFSFLEDQYVKTSQKYANRLNFRYIIGWSTTKEGDEIIQYYTERRSPSPDLSKGVDYLPVIYNGFWTICWLYRLTYVLMLSSFVLAVGGLIFIKQETVPNGSEPSVPESADGDTSGIDARQPIDAATSTTLIAPEETDKEIFISYAWGGESEAIADELERAFKERGVTIVRDIRDLGFKGRIKEFMEGIGRGKCVILVISDKYLKSANCMFELIQIARDGNFAARIFPVVLADALIYKPEDRLQYVQYWEHQFVNLDAGMRTVSAANMHGFREDIDLYAKIRALLPRLTDILRDMNTLTSDIHRESNFKELVNAVIAKLAD